LERFAPQPLLQPLPPLLPVEDEQLPLPHPLTTLETLEARNDSLSLSCCPRTPLAWSILKMNPSVQATSPAASPRDPQAFPGTPSFFLPFLWTSPTVLWQTTF
jgi:hypothetical protein